GHHVNRDSLMSGDYDRSGRTTLALWRPGTGQILTNAGAAIPMGNRFDVPVPGDYDGDGATDYAVWTPFNGQWKILDSAGYEGRKTIEYGIFGDIPVPGDYDGDGITDIAIFRPSSATFCLRRSSAPWYCRQWGVVGGIPVVGDFDGDGIDDLTVI